VRNFKQVAVDRGGEDLAELRLDRFLEEVVMTLRPQVAKTPHRLQLDCPNDVAVRTYANALAHVLSDLVGNALQHAFDGDRAGSIAISARRATFPATAGASAAAEGVLIVIRDDGRGMSPEVLAHVFEPFVTTRRGQGGTGLGLHIVYNQVTQVLRGRIRAESAPGEGTRFEIQLPASPS
jgi:signal transduction histidine kinase